MLDKETSSHDFRRSWMLPLLKDHIEATELSYFRDAMMPLADSLGAKGILLYIVTLGNAVSLWVNATCKIIVEVLFPSPWLHDIILEDLQCDHVIVTCYYLTGRWYLQAGKALQAKLYSTLQLQVSRQHSIQLCLVIFVGLFPQNNVGVVFASRVLCWPRWPWEDIYSSLCPCPWDDFARGRASVPEDRVPSLEAAD